MFTTLFIGITTTFVSILNHLLDQFLARRCVYLTYPSIVTLQWISVSGMISLMMSPIHGVSAASAALLPALITKIILYPLSNYTDNEKRIAYVIQAVFTMLLWNAMIKYI